MCPAIDRPARATNGTWTALLQTSTASPPANRCSAGPHPFAEDPVKAEVVAAGGWGPTPAAGALAPFGDEDACVGSLGGMPGEQRAS
jgi:hypothetical protein